MGNISNLSYLKFLKKTGVSSFIQNTPNNFYKKLDSRKTINIDNIDNIEDLCIFINNFKLDSFRNNNGEKIFFNGNPSSKIMFIVEGPTSIDISNKKLLSGNEGELFDNMLAAINLNREKIYVVPVVPWKIDRKKEITTKEILDCLPFVQKHIEIIKPKVLFLMGNTAIKAILNNNNNISKIRSQWNNYKSLYLKNSIPALASYDTFFLITKPVFKKDSWEDLKMLNKKIIDENI
jgi:uracil-DNA glycosylase family 4